MPVILYFSKDSPCCTLTDDKYNISNLYCSSLGRCETTEEITEFKKKTKTPPQKKTQPKQKKTKQQTLKNSRNEVFV